MFQDTQWMFETTDGYKHTHDIKKKGNYVGEAGTEFCLWFSIHKKKQSKTTIISLLLHSSTNCSMTLMASDACFLCFHLTADKKDADQS